MITQAQYFTHCCAYFQDVHVSKWSHISELFNFIFEVVSLTGWEGPLALSFTYLHSVQCSLLMQWARSYWVLTLCRTISKSLIWIDPFNLHNHFMSRLLLLSFFLQMRILRCLGVLFPSWCSRWQSWDTDPSRESAVPGLNLMTPSWCCSSGYSTAVYKELALSFTPILSRRKLLLQHLYWNVPKAREQWIYIILPSLRAWHHHTLPNLTLDQPKATPKHWLHTWNLMFYLKIQTVL